MSNEKPKPIISVEVMQGREWVKRAAWKTAHIPFKDGNLSDDQFSRMLLPEHSPIRQFRIWVDMDALSERVHTHLVRHRGTDAYVGSQRPDWLEDFGIDPKSFLDENGNLLRGMGWAMGADQLIHIARYRECKLAFWQTREVMAILKEELAKVEPVILKFMAPHCVWYGLCPECKKYCGYMGTEAYKVRRGALIAESERLRM